MVGQVATTPTPADHHTPGGSTPDSRQAGEPSSPPAAILVNLKKEKYLVLTVSDAGGDDCGAAGEGYRWWTAV